MKRLQTNLIRPFRPVWIFLFPLFLICSSCFDGMPVFGPPLEGSEIAQDEWQWFEVDGSICRDGSPTGIGLRVRDPKKLVIYLNGGGACFNEPTCASNPASFNEADFFDLSISEGSSGGIFNFDRLENPVRDWSFMFIPYCTGDVHMGTIYDGRPLGVEEPTAFVGSRNFKKALTFVEPYFESEGIEEILFFGLSAGGFGVMTNFVEVERRFPDARITVINDSGPLFDDRQTFSPCIQLGFLFMYGVEIPPAYPVLPALVSGGFFGEIYGYTKQHFPDVNFGMVSSLEDRTTRYFLSFGYNDCQGAPGNSLPADEFRQSLINIRDQTIIPESDWSTYYVDDDTHTQLNSNEKFFDDEVDDVRLYEWVARLLNGERRIHVGG